MASLLCQADKITRDSVALWLQHKYVIVDVFILYLFLVMFYISFAYTYLLLLLRAVPTAATAAV